MLPLAESFGAQCLLVSWWSREQSLVERSLVEQSLVEKSLPTPSRHTALTAQHFAREEVSIALFSLREVRGLAVEVGDVSALQGRR